MLRRFLKTWFIVVGIYLAALGLFFLTLFSSGAIAAWFLGESAQCGSVECNARLNVFAWPMYWGLVLLTLTFVAAALAFVSHVGRDKSK